MPPARPPAADSADRDAADALLAAGLVAGRKAAGGPAGRVVRPPGSGQNKRRSSPTSSLTSCGKTIGCGWWSWSSARFSGGIRPCGWPAGGSRPWRSNVAMGSSWAPVPHGAQTYATALLDTLDFLSERPAAAPFGATAASFSLSLIKRRITMLKDGSSFAARLTLSRVALLLALAALPMALAFAIEPRHASPKCSEGQCRHTSPKRQQGRHRQTLLHLHLSSHTRPSTSRAEQETACW